jgi:dienelactone hydrolase
MIRAALRVAIVGLLLGALVLTAAPARGGTNSVQTFDVVLTDDSRPTDATESAPGSEERVLATTVTYDPAADGPQPLVVLAHGHNGHPNKFRQLMGAWALAGYVVVAPAFPVTNNTVPGGNKVADVQNQPADLSFVIDEVLKLNRKGSGSPLVGRIDKRHIGVAGLSLGGATVYGLVYNSCCVDKRVDAAILMSAVRIEFDGGEAKWRHVPAMLIHGTADGLYRVSETTYPKLATPKWFVTLPDSTHAAPFEDSEDPADDVVPKLTIAFFDRYLRGEKRNEKLIQRLVSDHGGMLEAELKGRAISLQSDRVTDPTA